ncbi:MAG TPA: glycosyltransferase [Chthoniobacterales bacterium]|jgi:GT2 family glycosyltransferase
MSSSATSPELSVILIIPDRYATIRNTVRALKAQTVHGCLELVLVAPFQEAARGVEEDAAMFHSVQVVEFGEIRTLAAPRSAGVRAATAPLVALCEDHALPERNWAEALIKAHREERAAVGPAFLNGNPAVLSWISLIMDYGRWMDPVTGGNTNDVPGHNSAWKRSILLDCGSKLEQVLQAPTLLHWELVDKGHQLYLEPDAKVRHFNITRLGSFIVDHYYGARMFAGVRSSEWPAWQRGVYVCATPLFVIRKLRQWIGHIRRTGLSKMLPWMLPHLMLAAVTSGTGELIGFGFGIGKSEHKILRYDAHREPYLNQRDRHLLATS